METSACSTTRWILKHEARRHRSLKSSLAARGVAASPRPLRKSQLSWPPRWMPNPQACPRKPLGTRHIDEPRRGRVSHTRTSTAAPCTTKLVVTWTWRVRTSHLDMASNTSSRTRRSGCPSPNVRRREARHVVAQRRQSSIGPHGQQQQPLPEPAATAPG